MRVKLVQNGMENPLTKHKEKQEYFYKELMSGKKESITNEVLLNSIINSASNGILVVDPKGEILFINHLFIEMWKIPYELFDLKQNQRLLKVALSQLKSPEVFFKKIRNLNKSKDSDFDLLYFKDGRIFETNFVPLITENEIEGYIWNFNDITDKRQNKERLIHMNAVLNSIRNINKLRSITSDKCKLIHGACKNITSSFGYSKAKITLFENDQLVHKAQSGFGDEYNLFIRDQHEGKRFNCYKKVLNNNEVVIINSPENECGNCPLVISCKNSSSFVIALQYQNRFYGVFTIRIPSKYSNDKESQELFKEMADDISFTLKKIELEENHTKSIKALKLREARLDSIFKSSPVGMGLLSNEVIMHINDLFCEITGYHKKDIKGKNIRMLFATNKEYEKLGTVDFKKNYGKGKSIIEIKWKRKDEQIIDILFRASPVDQDDPSKGISFTATDITEKKKNEKDFKRLNFAIENSKNEIYIFDATTLKFIYVNKGVPDNLGYTLEELRNLTPTDIKPEYSITRFKKMIKPLINGSKSVIQFETVHKRKNRSLYHVEVNLSFIKTDDRPYFLAIILDISEKKKAEKKLKDFEIKFRVAFETSPDALIINRLHDGMYTEINEGFTRLTGFTAEDVIGKTNNDINIWFNNYDHDVMVKNLIKNNSVSNLEARFKKRTGEIVYGLMSANIIEYDGIKYILSITKDITALKKAEVALKENEEKYRALVENQGEGIMIGDIKENIIFVNPAAEKVFDLDKESLIGMNIKEFVDENQYKMVQNQTKKRMKGEKSSYEIKLNTGNNKIKTILITATPLYENEKVKYTLGIFRDITAWKEAQLALKMKNKQLQATKEELSATNDEFILLNKILKERNRELTIAKQKAEESDRLKSVFLANISHEIRTPLNGILGFSQLLTKTTCTSDVMREYADLISNCGDDLLQIINNIMDMSKIETSQLKLNYSNCNIMDILNDVYNHNKRHIKDPENLLFKINEVSVPDDKKVYCDGAKVNQILSILINNAIKFTAKGFIKIGCKEKDDNKLLFYVSDSGIGIKKESCNLIFERFRQSDESDVRKYGGAGLGLAIAKGLVEIMNGEIWFESELGNGTTFYFTIPYQPDRHQEKLNIKMDINKIDLIDWSKIKILIVEDDPYSIEYLTEVLSETKVHIEIAKNGNDALKKAKENSDLDLILMDIQLPGISGDEVTTLIREFNQNIPIIAQTAHAMVNDKKNYIKAGCTDYISKPILIDELFSVLCKYI
ncbi:MAG: PAS domain S-box protein [Bacteroidales bacterium]|nr:PAS domain S-box protein [Bacteroidales bacterium]